jgi:hypothetical protein
MPNLHGTELRAHTYTDDERLPKFRSQEAIAFWNMPDFCEMVRLQMLFEARKECGDHCNPDVQLLRAFEKPACKLLDLQASEQSSSFQSYSI